MGGIGGPGEGRRQGVLAGPVGVISRSGGMTTEMSSTLTAAGLGQSTAVSIGGDAIIGSSYAELMPLFEADEQTQGIVIYTEPGGRMEAELARWVTENDSRLPIVAFMAGRFMDEMPGMSFGHAGTIVEGKEDTAAEKIARLGEAGHRRRRGDRRDPRPRQGADGGGGMRRDGTFIGVEVDDAVAGDAELAAKLDGGLPRRHLRRQPRAACDDRRGEPRRVRAVRAVPRRRAAGHGQGAQALGCAWTPPRPAPSRSSSCTTMAHS